MMNRKPPFFRLGLNLALLLWLLVRCAFDALAGEGWPSIAIGLAALYVIATGFVRPMFRAVVALWAAETIG